MSVINETREDCTYTQHPEFVLTLLEQGKPKRKKKKKENLNITRRNHIIHLIAIES